MSSFVPRHKVTIRCDDPQTPYLHYVVNGVLRAENRGVASAIRPLVNLPHCIGRHFPGKVTSKLPKSSPKQRHNPHRESSKLYNLVSTYQLPAWHQDLSSQALERSHQPTSRLVGPSRHRHRGCMPRQLRCQHASPWARSVEGTLAVARVI